MPPHVPAIVAAFIDTIQVDDEPRRAVDWLEHLCTTNGWIAEISDAREWAERTERRFLSALGRQYGVLEQAGRFCPFVFNSSSEYVLQGATFIEPRDNDDIREAKRRRARFAEYVTALRGLAPLEFEALCAGILNLLGVETPHLTPVTGDEGIDFYGLQKLGGLIYPEDRFPTIQRQLAVWMVGQAKRYQAEKVATPSLRELVGAIDLAKVKAFAGRVERFADLAIRVCDPVVYLFFTTGRISADGWILADRSGIVAMDGETLASFLADREVGVTGGVFDGNEFAAWIGRYMRR